MPPFKDNISPAAIAELTAAFALAATRAGVSFDAPAFTTDAVQGLDDLELKARVKHVARAIEAHLPLPPDRLFALLVDAAGPPLEATEAVAAKWHLWPVLQVVENIGPQDIPAALGALRELTQRWSGEFAIRPLLVADPPQVFATLLDGNDAWVRDPDAHVRRLASEGTRPRLPWGGRLHHLEQDPTDNLRVLEALKDDPELYVRRSVANHLNDLSKVDPDLAVARCAQWLKGASEERQWVVKHALRDLLKKSHPGALSLMGFGAQAVSLGTVEVMAPEVAIGDTLQFRIVLTSLSDDEQTLMVDYAVHHRGARGTLRPKVFKWTKLALAPRAQVVLQRAHPMRVVSTRALYPGPHGVDVRVNGLKSELTGFVLRD